MDYFYHLAICNYISVNIRVHVFVGMHVFIFLSIHLEVLLLGHNPFEELSYCFPKPLYCFTFSPAVYVPISPHPSQPYCHLFIFYYNHPTRCEVVSHCGYDLHFPGEYWCWPLFHVLISHLYIYSGKISFQIGCPF